MMMNSSNKTCTLKMEPSQESKKTKVFIASARLILAETLANENFIQYFTKEESTYGLVMKIWSIYLLLKNFKISKAHEKFGRIKIFKNENKRLSQQSSSFSTPVSSSETLWQVLLAVSNWFCQTTDHKHQIFSLLRSCFSHSILLGFSQSFTALQWMNLAVS